MTPDGITLLLASGKWAGVPLYNITTLFVKSSVLAFYLRFLVETSFRVFTYIVIFVVASYGIINTAATLALNCTNDLPDVCGTMIRIYIACGALNVLTDVIILLLPFWILRPMKVPFHRKIGVALVLMGGGFVVAVSIIRLVATVRIDSDPDVTYGWGTSVMWW
ncbi:integral membrane protein [Colletotrichum sojae]|uniref:Integral membrane protein n=1 Tax=Colletotrichum sojae TaxID=2175907 RepID=A0A8H6IW53_9PEZI|nr:integral membrane protein [Colletotrichum sojae]